MNENEKAAIAAGVWEPGQKCAGRLYQKFCVHLDPEQRLDVSGSAPISFSHDVPAPDMHDPANWTRGISRCVKCPTALSRPFYATFCDGRDNGKRINEWRVHLDVKYRVDGYGRTLDDAAVAALVALYDAEHQTENPAEVAK